MESSKMGENYTFFSGSWELDEVRLPSYMKPIYVLYNAQLNYNDSKAVGSPVVSLFRTTQPTFGQ